MKRVSIILLFFLCPIIMVSGCMSLLGEPATAEEALAKIPPALRGDWQLTSMEINGQKTVLSSRYLIGISFIHHRELMGNTGCNFYYSMYSLTDSTPSRGPEITIGDPSVSKNNCSTSEEEEQYLSVIHKTWSYMGDGQLLTLTAENGDKLVFTKFTNRETESVTPLPTTPEPVEMAYLEDTFCRMDQTTETSYHCSGKVRIKSGVYSEVQVIIKYPDNNTFASEIFPMGGSNPVLKSFSIFSDLRYKDREPQYYVRLDKTRYFVNKNSNFGTAYINPPPTPVYLPWHAVVTTTHTAKSTTRKAPVSAMKVTGSGLSVSTIDPNTAPVGLLQFYITGSNFRQYPPPEVYLRKQGSSCEFCGVHATSVQYLSPEKIRCTADMRGMEGGAGTYDVLVTNSYLADSYAMLSDGLEVK